MRPSADPPIETLAWQYLRTGQESGLFVHRIPAHGENDRHDHIFHEIVYVESGAVEHHTAAGVQKLRPGDVIVIRPQVWHAYRQPRELTIINCLIGNPLMHRLGTLLTKVEGAFELYRRRLPEPRKTPPVVLHAGPAERAALLARLQGIITEQHQRRNGWEAAATAALLDLLVGIARLIGQRPANPAPRLPHHSEQAVLDIATHLEMHFTEAVHLDQLAARVDLSPAHLSRCFGKRMGMGIVEYVHRLRAEEACRLLQCTADPIADIATRVGYDEIAYFSRCFRAQTGQSPRQYRQSLNRPRRA
jgi:AraC family L-rhamnose operon transcriptional activator RhaR